MEQTVERVVHSAEACTASLVAVRDALYVLSGKWKIPLIIALRDGAVRFGEIQRALEGITPKTLSRELRELELNEFVTRTVLPTTPVTVKYELTPYSQSLNDIIESLRAWGLQHRSRIITGMKE